MVWISHHEMSEAHNRWIEAWPCPLVCDWSRFLGDRFYPASKLDDRSEVHWNLSDEGAHRIRLILTPHYKALLKAMAVQYVEKIF